MALVCRWRRFEMNSWKAGSRVVLYLLVAAACTSCVGAARPSLAEALLEDMLPASSTKCVGGGTTAFTFNHTSSQSTSKWDEVAVMFERSVFLAEMSHALLELSCGTTTTTNYYHHHKPLPALRYQLITTN